MPRFYRRRSFRRNRGGMRYGGRRNRARPSASRATPRTTLAPRHQYVKLKYNGYFKNTNAAVSTSLVCFSLQRPYGPFEPTPSVNETVIQNSEARGYTAYSTLFGKYVVHGVKIVLQCTNAAALPGAMFVLTHPTSAVNAATINSYTYASYPMGHTLPPSGNGEDFICHYKRYVNMNRVFGEIVKKHDSYVHVMDSTDTTNNGLGSFCVAIDTNTSGTHNWKLAVVMTFYMSLLFVNSEVTAPSVQAQVIALSDPITPGTGVGEPATDTRDYTEYMSTGAAHLKETLKRVHDLD